MCQIHVVGATDTSVNKTETIPAILGLKFKWREADHKQEINKKQEDTS